MKNKLGVVIASLLLMAIGCVIMFCCKFELAPIAGFGVTMTGAGVACCQLWNSRKEGTKSWVVALGIVLLGLGCFIAGLFLIMDTEKVKTFIGLLFAVLVFVFGIITTLIGNNTEKNIE